jgi:hypothetical protein
MSRVRRYVVFKKFFIGVSLLALPTVFLLVSPAETPAAVITVNPSAPWQGFMNVFETPQHGGAFSFGSAWGTTDLCANFSSSALTLSPNTIGDPNPFWYSPSGGPGAVGNKTMDANMYVEQTGPLAGQTVTFTGDVLSNTLVGHVNQLGNGWTSVAFIKDFAPDYTSSISVTAPLVNGVFNISLATINDPSRHVQYGFETIGPDVWSTDVGPYGSIQIAVPEPCSLSMLAIGGCMVLLRRRWFAARVT